MTPQFFSGLRVVAGYAVSTVHYHIHLSGYRYRQRGRVCVGRFLAGVRRAGLPENRLAVGGINTQQIGIQISRTVGAGGLQTTQDRDIEPPIQKQRAGTVAEIQCQRAVISDKITLPYFLARRVQLD